MCDKAQILTRTDHATLQHGGGRIAAAIRDIQESMNSFNHIPSRITSPSYSPSISEHRSMMSPRGLMTHSGPSNQHPSSSFGKSNIGSRMSLFTSYYSSEESPIGQGRDGAFNIFTENSSDKSDEDSETEEVGCRFDDKSEYDVNHVEEKGGIQRSYLNKMVGFCNLPNQVYRKSLRKGFEFTLLVVGETGLGKSTLINSMFLTDIYNNKEKELEKMERTVEVRAHQVLLEEGGVKLSLTVVDTPGYGDAVDNTDCWEPAVEYVEKQFDNYLEAETRVKREVFPDSRVHACLYFIAPSSHGLKIIDVEFMKSIDDKVNIIPVIAKADTLTSQEVRDLKIKIRKQLAEYEISVYEFPREDDEAESSDICLPFAIVGSNTVIEDQDGKKIRGRKYPWGCVNIEDPAHSDFSLLRNLLLCQHTQHMIDKTSHTHYENYRCEKLNRLIPGEIGEDLSEKNLLTFFDKESERYVHQREKMRNQMQIIYEKKFHDMNNDLELFSQLQTKEVERERISLDIETESIARKRKELEKEKAIWDASRLSFMQRNSKSMESLRKKNRLKFSLGTINFGNY